MASTGKFTSQSRTDGNQGRWVVLLIDSNCTQYHLVSKLAQGTSGEVQLLRRADNGRQVVRKFNRASISREVALLPDQECLAADQIAQRLAQLPAFNPLRNRFARLISTQTVPNRSDLPAVFVPENSFFRESWWVYCEGQTLGGLIGAVGQWVRPPHALFLNLIHQAVEAFSWMYENGFLHLDAHRGNIFLEFDAATDTGLRVVIGDFGYTQPLPNTARPCTDIFEMVGDMLKLLRDLRGEYDPLDRPMFDALTAIFDMRARDGFPSQPLYPRDLGVQIQGLKTAEAQYLQNGSGPRNAAAVDDWRNAARNMDRRASLFPSEAEARTFAATELGLCGPFVVVNSADQASIQAGVAELMAKRVDA